jgi:hypothetical protein
MADVAQVLATCGTTIVGVAVGAGLTYWFGALNRRHQEEREDATRWYDERFRAYAELSRAYATANYLPSGLGFKEAVDQLGTAVAPVLLVGSPEARKAAWTLLVALRKSAGLRREDLGNVWKAFEAAARKDLGHPEHAPSEDETGSQEARHERW